MKTYIRTRSNNICIDIFHITKVGFSSIFILQTTAAWKSIGCFQDNSTRAIPILEGQSLILDGHPFSRSDPIAKCKKAACSFGYECFAVQDGGWCLSSQTACSTYGVYEPSTQCQSDGEGGPFANHVYRIIGNNIYLNITY